MPARRDKHGAVVDEDTQVTSRGQPVRKPADATARDPEDPATDTHTPEAPSRYDEPTRLVRRPKTGSAASDGDTTVLHRRRRGARSDAAADDVGDQVTGWLVVIGGPGKGRALTLGLGRNEIGRAAPANVRLDFGDREVSRAGHAYITYDHVERRWYIQQGGGRNLIRLGNQPVLAPMPLPAKSEIRIGGTRLLFVPLCGEDFDWEDVEAEG